MNLNTLLDNHQNHLDFWEALEKNGGRLLFEEYVALYLKATLPGDTYWLGEDIVPAHIAQKYCFTNLLKGKRSLGGDVINIYQNRAVAYESKWFDDKETINLKLVANKQQVINKTGIDQLIFTTNARRTSDAVTEWVDEAGFMFQEEWITKEVYDTVKAYIKCQVKKTYKSMTLRPECLPGETVPFFEQAMLELQADFNKKFTNTPVNKILTRIFQHWPAASGKGSFPRLAYDMIFEPRWNYKKSYPINTVINPTLTVLKGNLVKHIHHDIGLGNIDNVIHVIYAGDVTKAAKDTEELQSIRSMAKVFINKVEFVKFLRETQSQTIWVHTTVHSYDRLAKVMKGQKKSFYFGHIDEVHHMIQPDYSTWTASLNDTECLIQIRLMSSANKRKARGTGATYSMDDPAFCDIQIKDLDEQTAVKLGYKRKTVLLNYVYDDNSFPIDWIERLEEGGQPLIKLKDTDIVVPMSWFMAVDSMFRFRVEYSERNHTKLTLNSIKECQEFAKFIKAIRPKLLKELAHSNNLVYRRLLKAKIMVADTQENSTVKLLKEVSAIPDTFEDSFIIHCRLLGEGWDPENGWIDSNMFISPTHSEIRIYQDVNRGSRIGDGSKSINYVVQFFLNDEENHFNDMFARVKSVGEALEIGVDEITEQVIFKEVRNIPKGKKMPRQAGTDVLSYYDEVGADFFANSFNTYIKEGRYHKFGGIVNDIFTDYHSMFRERMGWLHNYQKGIIYQELVLKYKDFFTGYIGLTRSTAKNSLNYKDHYERLARIVTGEHPLVSDNNQTHAINYAIHYEEAKADYITTVVSEWVSKASTIAFPATREQGKLNSTGMWPVHQINEIKQEIDTEFKVTKFSTKKVKNFPDSISKEIKNQTEVVKSVWHKNFCLVIQEIIKLCQNKKILTNNDLQSAIENNNIYKKFRTTSAGSLVSLLMEATEKSIKFKNAVKSINSSLYKELVSSLKEFKIRRDVLVVEWKKAERKKQRESTKDIRKSQWKDNVKVAASKRKRPMVCEGKWFAGVVEAAAYFKVDPGTIGYRRSKFPDRYYYE
jgi:hypothetical protein